MSIADKGFHDWSTSRPSWNANLKAAFMAGYQRALQDAADAMEAPTGSVCDWGHRTEDDCNGECSLPDEVTSMVSAKWLRDRAAGVGTKDGDDDE